MFVTLARRAICDNARARALTQACSSRLRNTRVPTRVQHTRARAGGERKHRGGGRKVTAAAAWQNSALRVKLIAR